jgi:outer membrane protein OmpA-like peptidoglycan-associated protein/tetratricopeptide (TPR) repeat protein
MKSNLYLLLLAFFGIVLPYAATNAQTAATNDALKKATADYNAFRYITAIDKLLLVIKADSTDLKAIEMLAYSYKLTNNYKPALQWFEKLSKQPVVKPDWALNYAAQLAIDQQYEKSENWYRRYLSLIPNDKRAANLASNNITSSNKNQGHWQVDYININTPGADYSPIYYKDGLIFSSNRQSGRLLKHVFEWDNSPFTSLFVVESLNDLKTVNQDSIDINNEIKGRKFNDDDTAPTSNDTRTLGQFSNIDKAYGIPMIANNKLSTLLNGKINTKYHNASSAVFPDGSIIFTRNNYNKGQTQKSTEGIIKLKLYTASGKNLKQITEFPYNSNEYSTGHPALNKAGNILIFTSDMPGGYGGTDLYYSVRSGRGPWTRPVNLGKKINTEGNEMFPYLDTKGKLYFASNGHAGLGGLDVFEVALKEMKPVENPRNMGRPINGSTDDFGLIISEDYKNGYFSSNRRGSDDIYQFTRNQQIIKLQGIVSDASTKIPLRNSRLLLHRLGGTDTLTTDANGFYLKEINTQKDYELTAQKPGYLSKNSFITSVGINKDSTIRNDVYLNRPESSQQYVLNNCDSLKKLFSVQNIYYDLDRFEIRQDARSPLDELVVLMKKYPEISIITSSHTDSRATEQYNRTLSLKRGESAKSYLVSRGISPSRVVVEYYGKTRLVNRCYEGIACSEENQQLNRRTEFDVILNGINITRQTCD